MQEKGFFALWVFVCKVHWELNWGRGMKRSGNPDPMDSPAVSVCPFFFLFIITFKQASKQARFHHEWNRASERASSELIVALEFPDKCHEYPDECKTGCGAMMNRGRTIRYTAKPAEGGPKKASRGGVTSTGELHCRQKPAHTTHTCESEGPQVERLCR